MVVTIVVRSPAAVNRRGSFTWRLPSAGDVPVERGHASGPYCDQRWGRVAWGAWGGSMGATSRAARTMPRGVPMSWMDELYDHPPLWVSRGAGSRFWDLDGHEYVDMYVADMSAFCGHAPGPVVRAVCER